MLQSCRNWVCKNWLEIIMCYLIVDSYQQSEPTALRFSYESNRHAKATAMTLAGANKCTSTHGSSSSSFRRPSTPTMICTIKAGKQNRNSDKSDSILQKEAKKRYVSGFLEPIHFASNLPTISPSSLTITIVDRKNPAPICVSHSCSWEGREIYN